MMPVVIPAFKAEAKLAKCLKHLESQTAPCQAFVRDNSNDNIYFTAAINEGLRASLDAKPKYVMLLNQDMYLHQDAVEQLVSFMEYHPECGIAQPLQVHQEDQQFVICGGGLEAFPFGKHSHGPLADFRDAEIPWCNGACMILRANMIKEIGLLDENLRFIGSDSDYCFTARARGWQVWRCATALGVHETGSSSEIADPALERIKVEDMLYFAKKWLSGDLYRGLSVEGSGLSAKIVAEWMQQLAAAGKNLDAEISS